jgi:hypothetical protein
VEGRTLCLQICQVWLHSHSVYPLSLQLKEKKIKASEFTTMGIFFRSDAIS